MEATPVDPWVPALSQHALNQLGIEDLNEIFVDERELLARFHACHGKSSPSSLKPRALLCLKSLEALFVESQWINCIGSDWVKVIDWLAY
jgi:hypothetical protein